MHSTSPARVRLWLGTDKCNPSLYEVCTGGLHGPSFLQPIGPNMETWRTDTLLACRLPGFPRSSYSTAWGPANGTARPASCSSLLCFQRSRRAGGLFLFSPAVSGSGIYSDRHTTHRCQSYPSCSRLCISTMLLGQQAMFQIPGGVTPILGILMCLYILWFRDPLQRQTGSMSQNLPSLCHRSHLDIVQQGSGYMQNELTREGGGG